MTRGTGNVFADLGFPDAIERKSGQRVALRRAQHAPPHINHAHQPRTGPFARRFFSRVAPATRPAATISMVEGSGTGCGLASS